MLLLKPFLCTHCGVRQPSLDSERRHILLHRKKYLKTQRLGMLWRKSERIGFHKNVISNIHLPEHRCKFCQSCFPNENLLDGHLILAHDTKKPYQCEIFQNRLSRRSNLNDHKRTHTKEKPYQCEICQKRFSHRNTLKNHLKTHTKENPYQCQICHQCSFTQWQSEDSHEDSHQTRNLIVATFVRSVFHIAVLWIITSRLTPKRNHFCVRFVRNVFHDELIWIHTW